MEFSRLLEAPPPPRELGARNARVQSPALPEVPPTRALRSKPQSSCVGFFFFFWRQICWSFSRFLCRLSTQAHARRARKARAQESSGGGGPRLPTRSPGPGEEEKGQAMEPAAAAPGKMAAAESRAGGASHPPSPPAASSSDAGLPHRPAGVAGRASVPPAGLSRPPSPVPALPADWPVPPARHSPAYLSAETNSPAMAAVAVDSVAIVPLRWRAGGQNTACEDSRGLRAAKTHSGTENGRLETPRGWGPLI